MAAERARSFRSAGSLKRSKSEGTLIDLSDATTSNDLNGGLVHRATRQPPTQNPFWNKLSASNPFLDQIVLGGTDKLTADAVDGELGHKRHSEPGNDDVLSSSSDEGNVGNFLERKSGIAQRSGRWRSASDILDELERKEPKQESVFKPPEPVLNPDFEWLKNDREAYKMAWLSHRQLTRSCLDLNLMSQSPGWAQTQATNFQVVSRIGHGGGLVQIPGSQISMHIPEGHVLPGEIQEVTLKALLEPPPGLNNNYVTTMSPLLEVLLSNVKTKERPCLEIKLSGEVKDEPSSQVMTTLYGLVSSRREGPYLKTNHCQIKRNVMRMSLDDLKTHFFAIAVAEASALEAPAASVWDYLDRGITVAVYGPRYIHPSFKVVIVVCCHEDVPTKLPFSDVCRGNKHLPPLVLQLWGKHGLRPDKLSDLRVSVDVAGSVFKVTPGDKLKEVRQSQLKIGTVLHLPVALSCSGSADVTPFSLDVGVKQSISSAVERFRVPSPPAAPIRSEKRAPRQTEKKMELARNSSIPEESLSDFPKFRKRPVNLQWYGVALKSVLRQPRVEYLLEYFKGDTVALMSRETVRSVGNSKVKEWYIGFLRGRTGLIHCRNVKVISRDQVIDFTGIQVTTPVLLDNMTLPFKKLTYMYSAIQTLITEHIAGWRRFADALGYKNLCLDAIMRRQAESEADKVACVLEKLKEDCHSEKTKRKFLHELMSALLQMDSVSLAAQLIQNTVILSTAVELGNRWRELAEKMGKLSSSQIAAYEAPHRTKNGDITPQAMWKPAFDFLYSWSLRYGNNYKDMVQDLHLILDKMKNPTTRQWRHLTGALITVNCLHVFQDAAYPTVPR